VVLNTNFNDN